MKEHSLPGGVIASLIVPFTAEGEIDLDRLQVEVARLQSSAVNGLCIGGLYSGMAGASSQELHALTTCVRGSWHGALYAAIFPDVTAEALEMMRAVADGGADAVLVGQPHYLFQPEQSGLLELFASLKASCTCPLLLADCLPEAKVETSATCELIGKKLIDGVLQAVDAHSLVDLLRLHLDVPVYSGIEDIHYVSYILGAVGVVSTMATVFPEEVCAVFSSFQQNRKDNIRDEHERLVRLWRSINVGVEQEARLRSATSVLGRNLGIAPDPYGHLADSAVREIANALQAEGLIPTSV